MYSCRYFFDFRVWLALDFKPLPEILEAFMESEFSSRIHFWCRILQSRIISKLRNYLLCIHCVILFHFQVQRVQASQTSPELRQTLLESKINYRMHSSYRKWYLEVIFELHNYLLYIYRVIFFLFNMLYESFRR